MADQQPWPQLWELVRNADPQDPSSATESGSGFLQEARLITGHECVGNTGLDAACLGSEAGRKQKLLGGGEGGSFPEGKTHPKPGSKEGGEHWTRPKKAHSRKVCGNRQVPGMFFILFSLHF